MRTNKKESNTRKQNILFAGIVLVVIIFIAGRWISSTTDYYFSVFVQYQEDTQGVLENHDALDLNTDEQALLEPLEAAFDSYRNQRLCNRVKITANDDVTLAGDFYDEGADITVIALQGFNSDSDSDFLFAPYYGEQGCNLLIPDSRTHGDSGGDYVGYGYFEKYDLQAWVNWVLETYGEDQQIVIHGTATGAVTAILAADEGLPKNVGLLVLDSPFSSLSDIVSYQIGNIYGLSKFPFMWLMDNKLGKAAGYRMEDVDVVTSVSEVTIPALFIIGEENDYIPPEQSLAVYEQYPGEKELISVPGARYRMAYAMAQEECENALSALLGGYKP